MSATSIDTTWCTKNFMETIQISKGLKATSEPLSFWLTNRGWRYIMDIITYTEHLVDHESAMCTRSIVADLPDSVTNLDSLLAFKCLFIIIGQRLFSSSHKFCLISATAHRWNLWKEGMLQSIVNHVPNNFNPNQFQKGESGYLQVLGHIKWKELTAAG